MGAAWVVDLGLLGILASVGFVPKRRTVLEDGGITEKGSVPYYN